MAGESCLVQERSDSWDAWWDACIRQFPPVMAPRGGSLTMQKYRRINKKVHRELLSLCFDKKKPCCEVGTLPKTMTSSEGNDAGKLQSLPSSSLIIQQPSLEKIYSGHKTWELRSKGTKKRGRIGLISRGSGLISGEAWLIDCVCLREIDDSGLLTLGHGSFEDTFDKHRCTEEDINLSCQDNVYAWVLGKVRKYETGVRYHDPKGALTWIKSS